MSLRSFAVFTGTLLLGLHQVPAQAFMWKIPGHAAPAHISPTLFQKIESAIDGQLAALANVTCHERIARYARQGRATRETDTLEASVSVLGGVESYSHIWSNRQMFAAMSDVPGTWSAGEMVTLLRVTRDAVEEGAVRIGEQEPSSAGHPVLMTFSYPAGSHHWCVNVNSQKYWMSFAAQAWASSETGEILRVAWQASDPPAETGASGFFWSVDFTPVKLAAHVLTLPRLASFEVAYKSGQNRVDRNVTHFSEYRRFGSDSSIHFGK
jgi:hypothetical protein